jgi:hypothetical protein
VDGPLQWQGKNWQIFGTATLHLRVKYQSQQQECRFGVLVVVVDF